MIIYHHTSLMDSTAQTVVNTVNCVGVMGKGIAAEFKKRYPDMYKSYRKVCDHQMLEPGKLLLWRGDDQWVLNFPTKQHWRSSSKVDWVELGLQKFVAEYEHRGIKEIAFPKLGCGNGNLDWDVVRPIMERYLDPLPITTYIHDFQADIGIPEHLEDFAKSREQQGIPYCYDQLWEQIVDISHNVGSCMYDLETQRPFSMATKDNVLLLETEDENRSFFAKDEVTDVWRILAGGMLTKKKIGVADSETASQLISIFSLLPAARPVQIRWPHTDNSEIAAELSLKAGSENSHDSQKEQLSMSWH